MSVIDVVFTVAAKAGDSIRLAGSDVTEGQIVFNAGTELGPAHIGVIASIGRHSVSVYRRARVAVLSTGDELVDEARPLQPGEIRESNRRMLVAMVAAAGATPVDFGVVRDDETILADTLRRATKQCDAIVTSGGVSMGDFDVVKAVLSQIADMTWMQIAIKPAKPFAFGLLDGTPVFGLPGNPVSAMVSFELIARPGLRRMMGNSAQNAERVNVRALADQSFGRRPDGKTHFVRVHGRFADDGRFHVRSTGEQGSHQLASTAMANGLAVLPDGNGVAEGGEVDTLLLR